MNNMLVFSRTEDVLKDLGAKVTALRLSCNWTREELSGRSGVAFSTLRRMEQTGEGGMRDYIAVLRTLNALDGLEALVKPPAVSPFDLMKLGGAVRKRARSAGRKAPVDGAA